MIGVFRGVGVSPSAPWCLGYLGGLGFPPLHLGDWGRYLGELGFPPQHLGVLGAVVLLGFSTQHLGFGALGFWGGAFLGFGGGCLFIGFPLSAS